MLEQSQMERLALDDKQTSLDTVKQIKQCYKGKLKQYDKQA